MFERIVSGRRYPVAAQSVWDSVAGRSAARQVVLGPAAAAPTVNLWWTSIFAARGARANDPHPPRRPRVGVAPEGGVVARNDRSKA
jgi:hypothetical protein